MDDNTNILGVFDGPISQFAIVFGYIAMTIVIILFIIQIVKAFSSVENEDQADTF